MTDPAGAARVGGRARARTTAVTVALGALLSACGPRTPPGGPEPVPFPHAIIPVPTEVRLTARDTFRLSDSTTVHVPAGDAGARRAATFLVDLVGNTVERAPRIVEDGGEGPAGAGRTRVVLTRAGADPALGAEGYALEIAGDLVVIRAPGDAGLFYGVQTLRHLLPFRVEHEAAFEVELALPTGRIVDRPRFGWRGAMLDVARHFFAPGDVERLIDLMALYKLNRLHLHLSDDQGWRIEIPGWPLLTAHGGATEVGGRAAGYYTTAEYEALVAYAEERFVTIVPEIDMPGHVNAALAAYPELNCDGVAPGPFTGTEVGFSALCPTNPLTARFVEAVVGEIAARTPGRWFHVGGDEVEELEDGEYRAFVEHVAEVVRRNDKTVVGWGEIASAELPPGTLVQLWRPFMGILDEAAPDSARLAYARGVADAVEAAVRGGARVILSPADRIYLDMKYHPGTILGLTWAGYNGVEDAYSWGRESWLAGLPDGAVAGVEAPLWTERVGTVHDIEFMMFPRLPGVAEIGWSEDAARDWTTYRIRLGAQAPRWTALGVNFYRSPEVPWLPMPDGSR